VRKDEEEAVAKIGLPSRHRYNLMVKFARDELGIGGDAGKAQAWATLALAEATMLSEP
jgi:hypothetical protein